MYLAGRKKGFTGNYLQAGMSAILNLHMLVKVLCFGAFGDIIIITSTVIHHVCHNFYSF